MVDANKTVVIGEEGDDTETAAREQLKAMQEANPDVRAFILLRFVGDPEDRNIEMSSLASVADFIDAIRVMRAVLLRAAGAIEADATEATGVQFEHK